MVLAATFFRSERSSAWVGNNLSSTRKKVVVQRFLPGPMWGYLPQTGVLDGSASGSLDLLDLSGRIQPVPLSDVKYVCYVRDFNTADTANPERLLRRTFTGRPRAEGLWLRLRLRDGEQLEGMAALDSAFADGWLEDRGVHLTPPDIRGNTQRMFVPRAAITSMEMLGVVTNPSRRKAVEKPVANDTQPDLFAPSMPVTRIQ